MSPYNDSLGHWEGMWSRGLKPGDAFDATRASTTLVKFLDSKLLKCSTLAKPKALVPGCGRGYDVCEMAKRGYDALGLDIAPTAVEAASEYSDGALEENDRQFASYSNTNFFELKTEGRWEGGFDLIFDYTFLCALQPPLREEWAANHRRLISQDGELVTLIFPIGDHTSGPPFAMSEALVRGLLEREGFESTYCEPVPHEDSHDGRAGKEKLAIWRLKN